MSDETKILPFAKPVPAAPKPHRAPTAGEILDDIAGRVEVFHTAAGDAFADVQVNGARQSHPVKSKGFRTWLIGEFFKTTGRSPNNEALYAALGTIEARAIHQGNRRDIFTRIAATDDKIYFDLGDAQWRAIEVDATGWRVIDAPPVRFRRPVGMEALPAPERGGGFDTLRPFVNVSSRDDFLLVVAWLLAALRGRGPYPVLAVSGEQGSSKSTLCKMLRSIIDPNKSSMRTLPKDERDLFIAANNGHVIGFDNLSSLPANISDHLCSIATGGALATRKLHTDDEESLFYAQKPIILNGISDVATRPDLVERAIFLTLTAIPENKRRAEAELWRDFEGARPRILGALLDAAAIGLANEKSISPPRSPRMADFFRWGLACEPALTGAGTFERAFAANQKCALDRAIDADPVAEAIVTLMRRAPVWKSTASALHEELCNIAGERESRDRGWPSNSRALSQRLNRLMPVLRKIGISIQFSREGQDRARQICICRDAGEEFASADTLSASAAEIDELSHVIKEIGE